MYVYHFETLYNRPATRWNFEAYDYRSSCAVTHIIVSPSLLAIIIPKV